MVHAIVLGVAPYMARSTFLPRLDSKRRAPVTPRETYDALLPELQEVARLLETRIATALDRVGDPYLVRARIDEPRIKTFESIEAKARRKGAPLDKALFEIGDLVGVRVVCHNLQDVRRVTDLLEQDLSSQSIDVARTDSTHHPTPAGYRAIHLEARIPLNRKEQVVEVGCEIQLRSLMQDSWARISREDLYGLEAEVPKSLRKKMRKLSDALSDLDELADEIRTDLAMPRKLVGSPEAEVPSMEGLALIYRSTFGQEPPDYVLQWVVRELSGREIRLDALHAFMSNEKLRKKLGSAHQKSGGPSPGPEQMFRWLVRAQVRGAHAALETASKEARRKIGKM